MSDKPFDPVTEGTPEEFFRHIWVNAGTKIQSHPIRLIAARDAAMWVVCIRNGLLWMREEPKVTP